MSLKCFDVSNEIQGKMYACTAAIQALASKQGPHPLKKERAEK